MATASAAAAAVALFNPSLSSFSHRRPQTLALTVAPPRSRCLRLPSQLRRSPFKASLKAAASDSKIINDDEGSEISENALADTTGEKILPTMATLIQAYKKAILDGDEESACELDAAICNVEYEKNDLSHKYAEAIAEIASGKDKFLRLKADWENFRKRSEKERITFSSDIQSEVFESLLPMIDSFERAKQHIKPETEKEKKIDTSYQSIYKQFVEIMRSSRVAVVETIGKPFDPSIHEAIGREGSQQFKEGIVVQEIRRGFFLGERLLRAATVKVSSGPGPRRTSPLTEGSAAQPEETQPEETAKSVEDTVR